MQNVIGLNPVKGRISFWARIIYPAVSVAEAYLITLIIQLPAPVD